MSVRQDDYGGDIIGSVEDLKYVQVLNGEILNFSPDWYQMNFLDDICNGEDGEPDEESHEDYQGN
jgi:hypothetical protein